MLPAIILQTIVIVLLFVSSAYVGNREIIRLFFELSLPIMLIQKLIKAIYFSSRMTDVHDRFKFYPRETSLNVVVLLIILLAVWLLCEWLIRRRAARKGS